MKGLVSNITTVRRAIFSVVFCIHFGLSGLYGQVSQNYFSTGLSFGAGTLKNDFVGELKQYNFLIDVAYLRRSTHPLPLRKFLNTIDLGWGIRGNVSHTNYRTNELRESRTICEAIPVVRLFFLQNAFVELGYSIEFFSFGHIVIHDPASTNQYTIPIDRGFESGVSCGAGYIIGISERIAIEPRVVLNFTNYYKSELELGNSAEILRNIRFVINICFIHSK